jgi:hypothetical protein
MIQKRASLFILVALASCSDSGTTPADATPISDVTSVTDVTTPTKIQEGQGPCDQGINLSIEGKQYFVPLALLPRTTVVVDGAQKEAIALNELLPASVLASYGFDGKFTTAQLRLLYDGRLAGEQASAAQITVAPESMATGYLLTADRSVYLRDTASGRDVQGVCRVAALRRLLVTRGFATQAVHVADLPTEPYVDQGTQTVAVTFKDLVTASGLLAAGETHSQFDYRMVPVDYLEKKSSAILFPWGHGHVVSLRWVPSLLRTKSLDTVGDLKNPAGVVAHQGVASGGWASIKLLLEVVMEPAPNPAHTVTGPDGPYTDPASCHGCHEVNGGVVIPVSCDQCHPR